MAVLDPDVKSVSVEGPVQPGTVFRWKAGPSSLTSTLQVVDAPLPTRVAIELVLFGAASAALAVAGQPLAAVVLGIAALITSLLNASQEPEASDTPPSP